jgi:DNA-binding IclR family transcriptional regulator
MFPHQRDVCSWALRLGRAAAFLGTGMGKSLIEDESEEEFDEEIA